MPKNSSVLVSVMLAADSCGRAPGFQRRTATAVRVLTEKPLPISVRWMMFAAVGLTLVTVFRGSLPAAIPNSEPAK